MYRFWATAIEPILVRARPRVLVEIGADTAANTRNLLEYCRQHDGTLHVVHPNTEFDAARREKEHGKHIRIHRQSGLEVLPTIECVDAVFINGESNWHTVHRVLKALEERSGRASHPFPIVFVQDVAWPYARRDKYPRPEDIPPEDRQPYARRGVLPNQPLLAEQGGLNPHFFHAVKEGGARNGVLTAVEDFLRETKLDLEFRALPILCGLGFLLPKTLLTQDPVLRIFLQGLTPSPSLLRLLRDAEQQRVRSGIRAQEKDGLALLASMRRPAPDERISRQQAVLVEAAQSPNLDSSNPQAVLHKTRMFARLTQEVESQMATERLREDGLSAAVLAAKQELIELRASLAGLQWERDQALARHESTLQHARSLARIALRLDGTLSMVLVSKRYRAGSLVGDFYKKWIPRWLKPWLWRTSRAIYHILRRFIPEPAATPMEGDINSVRLKLYDVCRDIDRLALRDRVSGRIPQTAARLRAGIGAIAETTSALAALPTVDIVVCVHNALEDVRPCLESILQKTVVSFTLYLVNDGSDDATSRYLLEFAKRHPRCVLINNSQPLGYTRAANQGLSASKAEYVILLNSDTIVSDYWLEGLVRCGESDPAIGIVGPLSNAATWQSVPERFGANGDWEVNALSNGYDVDTMSLMVRHLGPRRWPKVLLLNGFCLALKRSVVERIGYLDEEAFPDGYGEENDYCLRAAEAGFLLAVADDVYVYHAKSKSYDHGRRRQLAALGREALLKKYPDDRITVATTLLRDDPVLMECRDRIADFLNRSPGDHPRRPGQPLRILFILPVRPGAGGGHSVVQEVAGMRQLGADARVAIRAADVSEYADFYPRLVRHGNQFLPYREMSELLEQAAQFDVVVATINNSVAFLSEIVAAHPNVVPAYYIQDYEPLFYPEGSPEWTVAFQSYTLLTGAICFAKTRWLCDSVESQHGIRVHKVIPSLEQDIYHPRNRTAADHPLRIVAMIRPSTPRRAAPMTMKVLKRISRELGGRVHVDIYGCQSSDRDFRELERDFSFKNHLVLTREKIADLYRASHVFVDFSTYQAFGRTGLEAMACGVSVILPQAGGAGEYAVHGHNALVVDTESEEACYRALHELCEDAALRQRLAEQGLATAGRYSIERAALSELVVIRSFLCNHPTPQ
jgi:GT2 family glycosyltransferase